MEECPQPSTLEPWRLAALHEIDPHKLVTGPEDAAGRFFVALAVAFNDLKGLVMLGQYLERFPPPTETISAYAGQRAGLTLQVVRWVAGVLEETMKLIRMEGPGVIDTDAFRALLGGIAEQQRKDWETLVEVAKHERESTGAKEKKKPKANTLARVLYDVRNTAAFHYLGSQLGPAYQHAFDPATRLINIKGPMPAYYSPGNSMETTRFYFGDATVQQQLLEAGGGDSDRPADEVIVKHAEAMNNALGVLVSEFIKSRGGGPSKR